MILLWISAYTLCLINTLFVLYVWTLQKSRAVFALFLLVLNVFLTTAVPFIGIILNVFSFFAQFLMYILISLFSLSVPHFIFTSMSDKQGALKIPRWYIILCIICITVFSILFIGNVTRFSIYISFFLPLFSISSMIGVKKNKTEQSYEAAMLTKTGIWLFIVASSLFAVYGILHLTGLNNDLLPRYFFAVFPIAYQIPVFLYNFTTVKRYLRMQSDFLDRIMRSDSANSAADTTLLPEQGGVVSVQLLREKLLLSKREAETAIKLYEGKTYNQIADELFVSLSAVKKHAYNIYRKLDITNNRHLMQKINDIL